LGEYCFIDLFAVTRYRNFDITEYDEYIWGDFYINEGRNLIHKDGEVIGNIWENGELLNGN